MNSAKHVTSLNALRYAIAGGVLASLLMSTAFTPMAAQAQNTNAARPTAQDTAQAGAALLADTVRFTGTQLVASGNIEVHYGDTRLTAQRIVFDRASGALTIEGPIHLSQSGGQTVILASAAELSPDLRNGILQSARLVIDQQFQLAAASMERIDGRYTRLTRTVSSACKICEGSSTPLWQIRAKDVIHDSETRQLYFTNAQFRLWDVPVFYLPRLRLPDPTLERATGFMVPKLRNSTKLGTGLQVPYFIAIGDHRDLTISPYLSTRTSTVDFRYRQAFRTGDLEISGALSDDKNSDGLRGYLFADGLWDVGRDLKFGFDLRATSDISYLLDYDVFDGDRLPSRVWLERYKPREAFDTQLISIRSLRESEAAIEDTLPFLLGDMTYQRLYTPQTLGGTAWIELSASGYYRTSNDDVDGMDVLRTSAETGWKNSAIIGPGFRLDGLASATLDAYGIAQNAVFETVVGRVTPAAQARLSYPLERVTARGAYQTIEPIAQLSWSQSYGDEVPNSDSLLTEFDSGNLFAWSQFSGADRRGTGPRGAIGLKMSHHGAQASYGLTFGQILSRKVDTDYTHASGLSGQASDLLIGLSAQLPGNLSIASRALFDHDMTPTKWETRLDLARDRYTLGAVHSYVVADADENRASDLSELTLDSTVVLKTGWTASADYRYDFEQNQAAAAGFGLEYINECARVKLGISRRYTDTQSLDPTTNYSISVGFGAFGKKRSSAQGTCGL